MKKFTTLLSSAACLYITASAFSLAVAADPMLPPLPTLPSSPAATSPAPAPVKNTMTELRLPDTSSLSAPSLPPLSGNTNTVVPNLPPIASTKTASEPFAVPPLPFGNAPLFPSDTKKPDMNVAVTPPPVTLTQDTDKSAPETVIKHGKKHLRGHAVAQSYEHQLSPTYYISEPLPESIYRKSYDRFNRHLPVAYYERDYDRMVFTMAAHNDVNGLRALLDNGRNVELMDVAGDTPLLVAVKNNAINTARLLLARRANPEVIDHQGMSPLMIAHRNGNYAMQRALEEMGANPMPATNVSYSSTVNY